MSLCSDSAGPEGGPVNQHKLYNPTTHPGIHQMPGERQCPQHYQRPAQHNEARLALSNASILPFPRFHNQGNNQAGNGALEPIRWANAEDFSPLNNRARSDGMRDYLKTTLLIFVPTYPAVSHVAASSHAHPLLWLSLILPHISQIPRIFNNTRVLPWVLPKPYVRTNTRGKGETRKRNLKPLSEHAFAGLV